MKLGIDFGTTNSCVTVLRDGVPEILPLVPGEAVQRTVIHCSTEGDVTFGNQAFRAYVEQDLTGRFLRSIKSFLSHDVPNTTLGRRRYTFPEIVAAYLTFLIRGVEEQVGEPVTEVVLGRPVTFTDSARSSARAEATLRQAMELAGVPTFRFQLEPVAAAHQYERSAKREQIVLVGDFGGGTADFAVLRVGPDRVGRADRHRDILGTSGVSRAGDHLDGLFMDAFLMEMLGRGAMVRAPYTGELSPWHNPIHREVQALYDIHRLRDPQLEVTLQRLQDRLVEPVVAKRMLRLIFDDLGYPMAWAIEAAKRGFAQADIVRFVFEEFYIDELRMERDVDLHDYASASAPLLDDYRQAVDTVLERAGITDDDVQSVFLTGGTSQLPFVRGLFEQRFGERVDPTGDAFTSVGEGLVLS